MVRHEVTDADRPHAPVSKQALECFVRGDGFLEPVGGGLVQDEQVQVVDAELAGRFVPRVQGLVVAVVTDPDLGLQEHLRTIQARAADAFTDLPLVAVRGGGVDVPVAGSKRGLDRGRGLLGGALEDAQAKGWHCDAVVESKFHVHAFHGIQRCGVVGGHIITSIERGAAP